MKQIYLSFTKIARPKHLYMFAVLFALLPTKSFTPVAVADSQTDKAGIILIDPWDDIADVSREMNSSTGEVEAIVTYEKVNDVDASLNVPNNSYIHFDPAKSYNYFVMYHSDKVLPGVRYKLQVVFAPETKEGNVLNNQVPSIVNISTGYHNQDYSSSNELVSRFVLPAAEVTTYEAENIVSSQNDFYFTIMSSATARQILRGTYARVIRIAEIRLIPNEDDFSTIEEDGVYYTIVPASNYAQVCANPNKYTGEVVIPENFTHEGVNYSVGSIDSHAFENCDGLTSVTIPSCVTCIGEGAFVGCDHLITVKMGRSMPIKISEKEFTNRTNATLYVPRGSITAYRVADGWKDFKEIVEYGEDSGDNIIIFADAAVKALCVANWDTNGDGEMSMAEAAAVKDIGTVFNKNISIISFQELQYFTGLTTIGNSSFKGCTSLTSITIPNSVITIGKEAFSSCIGLTSISIPSSVNSIEYYAFAYCNSLATIEVDGGNTVYDSRNNCNAIVKTATNELIAGCKNTVIPNNVTSIGLGAFYGCIGLTSVVIPSGLTSIGKAAFAYCEGLSSIDIPSSVTTISDYAFYVCTVLPSITIPSSVTTIGYAAFAYCERLCSINIPSRVTSIGEYAFYGCDYLTIVKVQNSTPISIANDVFLNSFDNISATLFVPLGSKTVYESANVWKNFPRIMEYDTENDGKNIDFADVNVKALCVARWDLNHDGELSMEEAAVVTTLGNVFWNNDVIKSFDELKYFFGLSAIEERVFQACRELTNVCIPHAVTSIEYAAFWGCNALTSIIIPSSITSISSQAFAGTAMTSIIVENGNTVYDSRDNCNAIINTATNELVVGCINTVIPSSVTSIGGYAFWGCYKLNSITIPSSVKSIKGFAFMDCIGLTSITIPSSVNSLGRGFISGCPELSSIIVENGNTVFDSRENCNAVIKTATDELVAGCKNSIIPNSVTSIGIRAFEYCKGLTSITIPNSVTSIGGSAFQDCFDLTSVTIPCSVTEIGTACFWNCTHLTTVKVEIETPLNIEPGVFDSEYISKATLYVPKGSKAAYEVADVWKEFREIVEYDETTDPTGIDRAGRNADEAFDVYDMSGRKVRRHATTLNDLPKGVYVIGGRKQVVR